MASGCFLRPRSVGFLLCLTAATLLAVGDGAADEVSVSVTPLLEEVNAGSKAQQLLLFTFEAPKVLSVAPEQELAILLDVSLSMAEREHLKLAKLAITQIIGALRANDRLHLISSHGTSRIEFESGTTARKAELLSVLDGLQPSTTSTVRPADGSGLYQEEETDLLSGLHLAKQLLLGPAAQPSASSTRRLMLITDGKIHGGTAEGTAIIEAVERLQLGGALTSVVALGQGSDYGRWLLETAAEAGRGDFHHLVRNPQSLAQVVSMASASYLRTFATNTELRVSATSGTLVMSTTGHRRRSGHRRRIASDHQFSTAQPGKASVTDETVPVGTIRTGRAEYVVMDIALPQFRNDLNYLTYDVFYDAVNSTGHSTSLSHRDQLHMKVLPPDEATADPWPGGQLYQRFEQLMFLLAEIRSDEEAAEAHTLPPAGTRGQGSRWARLSERWYDLRKQLEDFAAEAAAAQRQLPSVAKLGLAQRAWAALEMTSTAGRSSRSPPSLSSPRFAVCEGAPVHQAASQGIEGLGH